MRASIVALAGTHSGRSFPLGDAPLVPGRNPDCSVVLGGARASRRHAEIRRAGFVLAGLDSANGTFVNHQRLAAPTPYAPPTSFRPATRRFASTWRSRLSPRRPSQFRRLSNLLRHNHRFRAGCWHLRSSRRPPTPAQDSATLAAGIVASYRAFYEGGADDTVTLSAFDLERASRPVDGLDGFTQRMMDEMTSAYPAITEARSYAETYNPNPVLSDITTDVNDLLRLEGTVSGAGIAGRSSYAYRDITVNT